MKGNNQMTVQSMAAGKVMQDLVDCLLAENFLVSR
ncbi:hypothetical protein SODG_004883 [Sodalis praecaptivus]